MEKIKNTISYAQKAAQKKYDQKTKNVPIKYTPVDMAEYQRLKNYIDRTGQSTNGFIKGLINNFFESGQDQKPVEDKTAIPLLKKRRKQEKYHPYYCVGDESIQFFYDNFGKKAADKILNEFEGIIEDELESLLESKGEEFEDWAVDIEERINDNEFQHKSTEEICKELITEMCNTL